MTSSSDAEKNGILSVANLMCIAARTALRQGQLTILLPVFSLIKKLKFICKND